MKNLLFEDFIRGIVWEAVEEELLRSNSIDEITLALFETCI